MNVFKPERFNWRKLRRTQLSKAAKAAFEDMKKDKDFLAWAEKNRSKRIVLREEEVLVLE